MHVSFAFSSNTNLSRKARHANELPVDSATWGRAAASHTRVNRANQITVKPDLGVLFRKH